MPPPVRAASPQDGEPDEPSPIGFEALKAELRKYSLPTLAFICVLIAAILVGKYLKNNDGNNPFETWELATPTETQINYMSTCHCEEHAGTMCSRHGLCNVSDDCSYGHRDPKTNRMQRPCLPDSLCEPVPAKITKGPGGCDDWANELLAAELINVVTHTPVSRDNTITPGPNGLVVPRLPTKVLERLQNNLLKQAALLCLPAIYRAISQGPFAADYFNVIVTDPEAARQSDPAHLAPKFVQWVVRMVGMNVTAPREVGAVHGLYRHAVKARAHTVPLKSLVLSSGLILPSRAGNTTAIRDRLRKDGISYFELVAFLRYCYFREYLALLDGEVAKVGSPWFRLDRDDAAFAAISFLAVSVALYYSYRSYSEYVRKRRAKEILHRKRREKVKSTTTQDELTEATSPKKSARAKRKPKPEPEPAVAVEEVQPPVAAETEEKDLEETARMRKRAAKRRILAARAALRRPYHGNAANLNPSDKVEDWDEKSEAWVTKPRSEKVLDDERRAAERKAPAQPVPVPDTKDPPKSDGPKSGPAGKRRQKGGNAVKTSQAKGPKTKVEPEILETARPDNHELESASTNSVKDQQPTVKSPTKDNQPPLQVAQGKTGAVVTSRLEAPTNVAEVDLLDVSLVNPELKSTVDSKSVKTASKSEKRPLHQQSNGGANGTNSNSGSLDVVSSSQAPTSVPTPPEATPVPTRGEVVTGRRGRGGARTGKGRASKTGDKSTIPSTVLAAAGLPPVPSDTAEVSSREPSPPSTVISTKGSAPTPTLNTGGGAAAVVARAASPVAVPAAVVTSGGSPAASSPRNGVTSPGSATTVMPGVPQAPVAVASSPAAYPHGYVAGVSGAGAQVHPTQGHPAQGHPPQMVTHVFVDPATGIQYAVPQGMNVGQTVANHPREQMGPPVYYQPPPQEYIVHENGMAYLVAPPHAGGFPGGGQYVVPPPDVVVPDGRMHTFTGPDGVVYVASPQFFPGVQQMGMHPSPPLHTSPPHGSPTAQSPQRRQHQP